MGASTKPAIGLDIGGGSTKLGLLDPDKGLIEHRRIVPEADWDAEAILAAYRNGIAEVMRARGLQLADIGVAYPGHVDAAAGTGSNSNVPALDGFPLLDRLAETFSCRAVILNDADAAAYAESRAEDRYRKSRFLFVTFGTGIGVGFVDAGRPVSIFGGTLGDPGHINVDPSGAHRCRQGCAGCLESVASAPSLEREACERAQEMKSGPLVDLFKAQGKIEAGNIVRLAQQGDATSLQLLQDSADWLAMAIVSWSAIFHPHHVVIGGGLSAASDLIMDRLRKGVACRAPPFVSLGLQISVARLGNDAGVIGAAQMAQSSSTG